MRAQRVFRLLVAAALLWIPVSASANPITYNFTSGQLTVTATLLTPGGVQTVLLNGSPSVTVGLTGTSVTFNDNVLPGNGLPAFTLTTSPAGPLTLSPALGSITSVSFGSLSIGPGVGYTSGVSGSNPYAFNAGPVLVTGTISLNGGAFNPFSITTGSLPGSGVTGLINVNSGELDLSGISIWQRTVSGNTLLIKGDVVFHGVPEPGLAVLIACAGAALATRMRRA